MRINRRTFLKDAAILVASLGLNPTFGPKFADALELLATGRAPLLWLQGQSCSGCSVSLINSASPGPADLLTRYLSLYFHQTLSAATGESALEAMWHAIDSGGYLLAVEGSIPVGLPEACRIGDRPFTELLGKAAQNAQAIFAVGTCASFGGVPAAPPNPTGAVAVDEFIRNAGLKVPLVNIPGCPAHPAWVIGNLVHLLKIGIPELDDYKRPKRTYAKLIHDQCQNFAQYQKKSFVKKLGEEGCLFKLGCQGVIAHGDCPVRGWNGTSRWCVNANAACAGCTRPEFCQDVNYPFYRLNESQGIVTGG